MRAGLREAGDIVVGEFEAAGQRVPVAGLEAGLVGDHEMLAPASGRETPHRQHGSR